MPAYGTKRPLAEPSTDLDKEFSTIIEAYSWLMDFTADQLLKLESDYDFTDVVELL